MLADIFESLGGYFDYGVIKKLYTKYSSTKEIINRIQKEPYESLCQINRIGFKTADNKLIQLEKKIKSNLKKNGKI